MKTLRPRDHPKKQKSKEVVQVVVALLLVISAAGVFASLSLFEGISNLFDKEEASTSKVPSLVIGDGIYDIDVTLGSGKYAAADGVLTYSYKGDYTASGFDLGFGPGKVSTIGGNAENSSTWTSVVDEGGNDVLEIGQVAENSGNCPEFPALTTHGDRYVFETDIRWLGSEGGVNPEHDDDDPNWFFRIEFFGDTQINGNSFYYDMFCMYKLGDDYFYLSNDHEIYDYEVKIKLGTWVNLRIEYVPLTDSTADVYIYINNKLAATELGFKNKNDAGMVYSNSSFTKVQIENRGKCYDYLLQMDNTYVSAVDDAPSLGGDTDVDDFFDGCIDPDGWTKVNLADNISEVM